ncbi:MAG: S-layer homology domain-containing protein, partial [Clostridia bacterium]|nr:S-layer homology domain-containing protein [Clostridia bacterium]
DCAISAITVTEQRDEVIDFTTPYLSASVTYKDGDEVTQKVENYAVVFPQNSVEKEKLIYASGDPTKLKYTIVNDAIKTLLSDATVDKLAEKYNLNKAMDGDGYDYEFTVWPVPVTEKINEGKDIAKYDTWEEIGLENPMPSDWARDSVDKAYELGIAKEALYFTKPITREQFCELIYNLIIKVNHVLAAPITDSFTDTSNEKVLMLNGAGIINGKSAKEFCPDDSLTRAEAATIIVRMINKLMPMAATDVWFEFDDVNDIPQWAYDAVQTICNLGFMNGVGDNKFAPNVAYTAEQAIVTLVRVYEGAEAAGIVSSNANVGIIGGADGPTQIIVGGIVDDDTTDNKEFVVTDTAKVDSFYIDEAIKLVSEGAERAQSKEYTSAYTSDEEMLAEIEAIGSTDYSEPEQMYYLFADKDKIIAEIKAQYPEEAAEYDLENLPIWSQLDFAVVANMINASYGSKNLAAMTLLANSRGYVMPKDFDGNFALYIEYNGGYSAIVSFAEYGDGVIRGSMSFVKNGDKDNMFRRIEEITSALGKDSITVAKVSVE